MNDEVITYVIILPLLSIGNLGFFEYFPTLIGLKNKEFL